MLHKPGQTGHRSLLLVAINRKTKAVFPHRNKNKPQNPKYSRNKIKNNALLAVEVLDIKNRVASRRMCLRWSALVAQFLFNQALKFGPIWLTGCTLQRQTMIGCHFQSQSSCSLFYNVFLTHSPSNLFNHLPIAISLSSHAPPSLWNVRSYMNFS